VALAGACLAAVGVLRGPARLPGRQATASR
jgi:hypothetical protein